MTIKQYLRRLAGGTAVALSLVAAAAQAEVQVGQPAPDFSLPGSDGQVHTLSDLRGQYVVLAFFPKAYTKG